MIIGGILFEDAGGADSMLFAELLPKLGANLLKR
jgi:hypothetical protein